MDNGSATGFRFRRQRRRKRQKVFRFLLLIFIFSAAIYMAFNFFAKSRGQLVSPMSKITRAASPALQDTVEKSLEGTTGFYGVAIKNLKTKEAYYTNEHRIFQSGSIYKLWVMATVFKQIREGSLTGDEVLSEGVAELNQKFSIDPDSAELTEGTITFTVNEALKQMITISHNYAALILTEKVKLSSVATFLKETGLNESAVGTNGGSPTTTASDVALFFEKLYKGELANEQYTKEMMDLLKAQQLDGGLPKYLPDNLEVAHKTGEIDWFKHDAGIVFSPSGDYIIVVMSETKSPLGAQDRIGLVSKAAYEYFTKSKLP